MKKISESQVNAFIEDERKASEEYSRIGANKLASDEARHHRFWLNYRKRVYGY
jgi:hypothetical protein